MESREDLMSILPFLPLRLRSSSLCWPYETLESLKALSRGPQYSGVDSGALLFSAIIDLRNSIGLYKPLLARNTAEGYAHFFDVLMDRCELKKWFGEVVPFLASLLVRLPSLLEDHYQISDKIFAKEKEGSTTRTGELIGALLACSFFCLFPTLDRSSKHLPTINFDNLFARLYGNGNQNQEHKIKCIIHYFERISLHMPVGVVSFERKVLSLKQSSLGNVYPDADFWNKSVSPLCSLKVCNSGLIEDQEYEAIEIDFANEYIGGGTLSSGCVQEEIRFMINPELIISMLFLPSMEDNEAIEIVGPERFSNYTGYKFSFRFSGDYLDMKHRDPIGRRKTRIVAIDALRCCPVMKQYGVEGLLREINKALCGFLDHSRHRQFQKPFQTRITHCRFNKALNACPEGNDSIPITIGNVVLGTSLCSSSDQQQKLPAYPTPHVPLTERTSTECMENCIDEHGQGFGNDENIGVATGNWGCGVFHGDPELKSIIQWLAASQARRPFVLYFTFGETTLRRLEEVSEWILSQGWTVGQVWNKLLEYSSQRLKGKTNAGLFSWLLPALPKDHVTRFQKRH